MPRHSSRSTRLYRKQSDVALLNYWLDYCLICHAQVFGAGARARRVLRNPPDECFRNEEAGIDLLLPPAAERLVKLYHTKQFLKTDLRQVQLRLEQIPVGVQGI
jgi:hypothetical protein